MNTYKLSSLSQLPDIAAKLAEKISENKIVCFYGTMGAGKTTLIKAISIVMGVENIVTSPTFALVNAYLTISGKIIFHFDLFRINKVEELYDLGYEDYFYSGNYCFIEWPEKASDIIPPEALKITITVNADLSRTIVMND